MFFSNEQLRISIGRLNNINPFFGTVFLAFKLAEIPVGSTKQVIFSKIVADIMQSFYRPISSYPGFYTPYKTSNPNERWNDERYPSTTLQRITADTFGKALIHPKGSQMWGWQENYIDVLLNEYLQHYRIPAFDLAVWLFQNREWYEGIEKTSIIELFFVEFKIKVEERVLFDTSVGLDFGDWLQPSRISNETLLDIIGDPPNSPLEESAILASLTMTSVGPAEEMEFDPAPRLNLITGDNGLGKSFLLECTWWALTGSWAAEQAYPRHNLKNTNPSISCTIASNRRTHKVQGKYDRTKNVWNSSSRKALPGLSIFARSDGSFAVWDPARRRFLEGNASSNVTDPQLTLTRNEVLEGKTEKIRGRTVTLCQGLIQDWIDWQYRSDMDKRNFDTFKEAIRLISPHYRETLIPGDSTRLPPDLRDMPTLRFSYGDIPFILCSAGIQRIVSLVYMLVWSWLEHLKLSEYMNRAPERSIVILIDEMEAHLHPFWQRTVIPALMNVVQSLNRQVRIQAIIATHSPLVLASIESIFNESIDNLFNLYLDGMGSVRLDNILFVKHGKVDDWLTSNVFGLIEPRSTEAEEAIQQAIAVQQLQDVSVKEVKRISDELLRVLGSNDEFWVRWIYFARSHGVEI